MVTIIKQKRLDHRSCLLEFQSNLTEPVFYIYINGLLAATTTQTRYIITSSAGESVTVEILDNAEKMPAQIFPGKITLGFFYVDGADRYIVEELIGQEWRIRSDIKNNNGYMQFESRTLEDGTDHHFKITAVTDDGQESESTEFTVFAVRTPDVPDVRYIYDPGNVSLAIEEVS